MSMPKEQIRNRAFGAGLGWFALGLANMLGVTLWVDLPVGGPWVRIAHHGVDLGRHIALGLVSAGAVLVASRGPAWRGWAPAAAVLASLGVAACVLPEDLAGIAERNHAQLGVSEHVFLALLVIGVSLVIPVAVLCAPLSRHPMGRLIAAVVAAAVYYVNVTISPRTNFGAHFFLSWFSAILLGHALTPTPALTARLWAAPRWPSRVSLTALGVWGLAAFFMPVRDSTRIDIGQWHANLFPEVTLGGIPDGPSRDREGDGVNEAGDVAPTRNTLLPDAGLVIVLSVDAFRADVLQEKYREFIPTIFNLSRTGTWFRRAYAPGSSTVYSLAGFSTGRYFSQLYWTRAGGGDWWPWEDDSLHLAQILSRAGIHTAQARGAGWMDDEHRILHGFRDSVYPKGTWKWARGEAIADRLVEVIRQQPSQRMFLFAHFLDTHWPYWPGVDRSKDHFERYLHALKYVDDQVARILRVLDEVGAKERAVVMITADHGEAFGEHRSRGHALTLYEEAIRVPLVVSGARIPRQERDDLVGTIDLGPTILDLFGLPTPRRFMGESLVPLLQGEFRDFKRPIVAEAKGLRAVVFSDGIKVIHHRKSGTIEIYDLNADPREKRNLSDDSTPGLEQKVEFLHDFFRTHTLRREGYQVPHRK
jgi:arylsulfatase A-like enzyme